MYTEDEAKNKRCCCDPDYTSTCDASRCMAWRWCTDLVMASNEPLMKYKDSTTHGYCGLAGKP